MRWCSTPQSVERGEISALAILETLLAMAVSFGVAYHYGSYWHLLLSASIAPLLLLRTRLSVRISFRLMSVSTTLLKAWAFRLKKVALPIGAGCAVGAIASVIVDQIGLISLPSYLFKILALGHIPALFCYAATKRSGGSGLLVISYVGFSILIFVGVSLMFARVLTLEQRLTPIYLIGPLILLLMCGMNAFGRDPVYCLVIRVFATYLSVCRERWQVLGRIPNNWKRVCLSTDIRHPPEVMPGAETRPEGVAYRVETIRTTVRVKRDNFWLDVLDGLGTWLLITVLTLTAFLYRFSIKSTSIVWLPLFWIASDQKEDVSLGGQLAIIPDFPDGLSMMA